VFSRKRIFSSKPCSSHEIMFLEPADLALRWPAFYRNATGFLVLCKKSKLVDIVQYIGRSPLQVQWNDVPQTIGWLIMTTHKPQWPICYLLCTIQSSFDNSSFRFKNNELPKPSKNNQIVSVEQFFFPSFLTIYRTIAPWWCQVFSFKQNPINCWLLQTVLQYSCQSHVYIYIYKKVIIAQRFWWLFMAMAISHWLWPMAYKLWPTTYNLSFWVTWLSVWQKGHIHVLLATCLFKQQIHRM